MTKLLKMPFCVQVHHLLHVDFMSEKRVKTYVVSSVFFLVYDEKNNSNFLNTFMQIHVLNFLKTFLKKMKKTHQSGTEAKEVKFKYERPRIFCYYCGKFGHVEDYCEILFSQASNDGVKHGVLVLMSRLGVEAVDD